MTFLARRHNDQMMCHHCGLVWDVNDPEPPTCLENRLPGYLQCDREDDELSLTEAGLTIERVALVSGHADWTMLRRYTHLKPESLHAHFGG